MNLPAADDLFRRTGGAGETSQASSRRNPSVAAVPDPAPDYEADLAPEEGPRTTRTAARASSGRIRHDEKMTVYVTSDELVRIEQARLHLRADHGLAIDRGRLVREAVAMVLADFVERGDDSALVQRLSES